MSSSRSFQWIPRPRPISRQRLRSAAVARNRRGYHARGAEMLRPSLNSTRSVPSETATSSAKGTSISIAEILIPSLHELNLTITNQSLNPGDFCPRKSTTALRPYWIEPEFCDPIIPLDMHMRRLASVSSAKRTGDKGQISIPLARDGSGTGARRFLHASFNDELLARVDHPGSWLAAQRKVAPRSRSSRRRIERSQRDWSSQ